MTLNKLLQKLRAKNAGQYRLLGFCIFLSVFLISAFAFLYFGPTVQEFLPEGGDTRKMAMLLLGATAVGCAIFTVYASTLFFRRKSREFGVLLALGASKRTLTQALFRELFSLTVSAAALGVLLGLPASFLIWKLFELFLVSTPEMSYRFGAGGLYAALVYALVLALILSLMGKSFVSRQDLMEVLKTSQKTEMVREIRPWVFPLGVVLTVAGLAAGLGINQLTLLLLRRVFPGTSFLYLLSVAGIYLILLSAMAQNRLTKKKDAFYRNMVSVSLMRFSAKSATRSMCVIVLLLFSCLFSAFYGLLYSSAGGSVNLTNGKAYAMHYPAGEQQLTLEKIGRAADRHGVVLTDYARRQAINLVISYRGTDYEDGRYVDADFHRSRLALFLSADAYTALTGQEIHVKEGHYRTIVPTDYKENVWDLRDGLYEIMHPENGTSLSLTYEGFTEHDNLCSMSEPFAYVLNDIDYAAMTDGLSDAWKEELVLFDAQDGTDSYAFGKELLTLYTQRATALSDHLYLYDKWEEQQALAAGEDYVYAGTVGLSPDNTMLLSDWKYAPSFAIVTLQDRIQLIGIYVMLCLYIFIISLSAVAVMCYVRSVSVAEQNRPVFSSLEKLGADRSYRRRILRKQLARIFQYPGLLGCLIGWGFCAGLCWTNDQRFTADELQNLTVLLGVSALILSFLYLVYRASDRQARKTAGV
ncbi:MAG: ABC transporter permease [Eubacteriales bacterium]|nr:ABC transporter permease [Eubacteriales bacterium]